MQTLIFTVTNDLSYDQRMIRICSTLSDAGYDVTLIGRKMNGSLPLSQKPFRQKRLNLFFSKGKLFYAEYNLRLFFYLLFQKATVICAIDLDSILACYWASRIKKWKRVYDAHELFCEMKEIVSRPRIYRAWKKIENFSVPRFQHGYTVNSPIKDEFKKMYCVSYDVIRNMPRLKELILVSQKPERYILYQGAVNEGRSFETLIPAMKMVNAKLLVIGDGNFMEEAKKLVKEFGVEEKVLFKGKVAPEQLPSETAKAWIGITIFEAKGLSNYYSLANRFFDYIHAGIPQLGVDYPVYREINAENPVAVLINDLSPANIAEKLNLLLTNDVLYGELQQNCLIARKKYCWQEEEKKLLNFYLNVTETP